MYFKIYKVNQKKIYYMTENIKKKFHDHGLLDTANFKHTILIES